MPWELKKQTVALDGLTVALEFWAGADKNGLPLRVEAQEVSLEYGPPAPEPKPPEVLPAILAAAVATGTAKLEPTDVQPVPGKLLARVWARIKAS